MAPELEAAAKSLQSDNSPGPDGFLAEFWKQLAPHLLEKFTEPFILGEIPQPLTKHLSFCFNRKVKIPCCLSRIVVCLMLTLKYYLSFWLNGWSAIFRPSFLQTKRVFFCNRHSFFNFRKVVNVAYNPSTST